MAFDKAAYWAKRNLPQAERAQLRRESKLRTIQVLQCKKCRGTSGTVVAGEFLCNRCPGTSL